MFRQNSFSEVIAAVYECLIINDKGRKKETFKLGTAFTITSIQPQPNTTLFNFNLTLSITFKTYLTYYYFPSSCPSLLPF